MTHRATSSLACLFAENPYRLVSVRDMQRFYAAVNVTDLMYLMTARTLSLNHETEFMKDLPHTLDGVRESSNEIGFTHVVAQVDRLKHWIAQGRLPGSS